MISVLRRRAIQGLVGLLWFTGSGLSFTTTNQRQGRTRRHPPTHSVLHRTLRRHATSNDDGVAVESDDERERLLEQRNQLSSLLVDIQTLQGQVEDTAAETNSINVTTATLDELEGSLTSLEQSVERLASDLLPPPGLSRQDYALACATFVRLPVRIRWALCESLQASGSFNDKADALEAATQVSRVPEIVSRIYKERATLTPKRLEDALKATEAYNIGPPKAGAKTIVTAQDLTELFAEIPAAGDQSSSASSLDRNNNAKTITNLLGDEETEEEMQQRRANSLLPRVTRKEDRVATREDLDVLLSCLKKTTDTTSNKALFTVSETAEIDGGWIVRGVSQKKTGQELIDALDKRLPENWPGQVCFMEEFAILDGGGVDQDPVLLLLRRDMSPTTNPTFLSLSAGLAVITAVLFSLGVYGGNELVTSRITEQTSLGDFSGIDWFNSKVLEVLAPLLAIQLAHESGHFLVGTRDNIKTSFPWLMPCLGLPFMGALTNLRESPKNFSSLFDFAIAGPVLGFAVSMGFFITGLQLGNLATNEVLQYYPALPVNVIKISTLGGSILDFFAGGEGFVTSQDPSQAIRLHPLAIAGLTGLVMNALELLPLGATDGGRLSLAVFGRKGHAITGGLTWCLLLFAAFFVERADAIIGAWAVYNIAQNDAEIPCRDEVTQLDGGRVVIAFLLWFVALLTFLPMS